MNLDSRSLAVGQVPTAGIYGRWNLRITKWNGQGISLELNHESRAGMVEC